WRRCRFVVASRGGTSTIEADSDIVASPPRAVPLTVGFALPKGDRTEWIVQKLTEIGIDQILLLRTDRSVTIWDGDRVAGNVAKLASVAREAAMQSRRVRLPVITGPLAFASVSDSRADFGGAMVMAEPGEQDVDVGAGCSTILIGPEGGWSPGELECADALIGLADLILRVETAALVAAVRLMTVHHVP
ncbi:MAG: RsmE family RNA methyltransferase, partial [Ilumatobacteraceae bacterium]